MFQIRITDTSQTPEKTGFLGACIGKLRQFETIDEPLRIIRETVHLLGDHIRLEVVEIVEDKK